MYIHIDKLAKHNIEVQIDRDRDTKAPTGIHIQFVGDSLPVFNEKSIDILMKSHNIHIEDINYICDKIGYKFRKEIMYNILAQCSD